MVIYIEQKLSIDGIKLICLQFTSGVCVYMLCLITLKDSFVTDILKKQILKKY